MNNLVEIIQSNISGAVKKSTMKFERLVLMGILAGMFIALGGATSNTAVHAISNVGLARTLAGVIFPVGLLMIVLVGGELFTGNCLMIMAYPDKKIRFINMLRNLVIVFCSNLIGSLIITLLVYYSGNLDYTSGALGAYSIKVALGKATITPVKAITSGILCNILVCMAILMGASSKEVAGKILAIFFPIFAFVIGGFEHVVANMYYIPIGLLAKDNSKYAEAASKLYGITAEQLSNLNVVSMLHNFLFVAIGNILGGMLFVGLVYYTICKKTN
jgi:formate/nitrite transporter